MEKVDSRSHAIRRYGSLSQIESIAAGVDLSLHLPGLSIVVARICIIQVLGPIWLLLATRWALPLLILVENLTVNVVHRNDWFAEALAH